MKEEGGQSRYLRHVKQADFLPILFIAMVICVDRGIGS